MKEEEKGKKREQEKEKENEIRGEGQSEKETHLVYCIVSHGLVEEGVGWGRRANLATRIKKRKKKRIMSRLFPITAIKRILSQGKLLRRESRRLLVRRLAEEWQPWKGEKKENLAGGGGVTT